MITLWHQNSHDKILNAKYNINQKKSRVLFIFLRLYFEAATDLAIFYDFCMIGKY